MIYEKRTIPHAAVGTDAYGFFSCIPKTTRWASGSKEAAADEEK